METVQAARPAHRAQIGIDHVTRFLRPMLANDFHAKRVDSIAGAVTGVVNSASLGIAAIGAGLAAANSLDTKHAVKQVDRLLSNKGLSVSRYFAAWVPWVLAGRDEVFVNFDWTDIDASGQSICVLGAQTHHGRTTALMWKTVLKSEIKEARNDIEDDLLREFAEVVPANVRVTIVADRGFSDIKLYEMLSEQLGFDYMIRFRNCITVSHGKQRKPSREWLSPSGRMKVLKGATVTADDYPVPIVVLLRDPKMKDAWFIASSRDDLSGRSIVQRYGKRFSVEETFRDLKDPRFGLGLRQVAIKRCDRRDRLMMLATLAHALLTLLGQAGEDSGLDRTLKVNTSKRRQHSLFRQGLMWYAQIPNMRHERLRTLMEAFGKRLREHQVMTETLGVL